MLQPKEGGIGGGMGRDEQVLDQIENTLKDSVPFPFELEDIRLKFKTDTPLHVVLQQECER